MNSARFFTSPTASPGDRQPEATRAVYSPRLWPSTAAGAWNPERSHRATLTPSTAGWALTVRSSSSAGPSAMRAHKSPGIP